MEDDASPLLLSSMVAKTKEDGVHASPLSSNGADFVDAELARDEHLFRSNAIWSIQGGEELEVPHCIPKSGMLVEDTHAKHCF